MSADVSDRQVPVAKQSARLAVVSVFVIPFLTVLVHPLHSDHSLPMLDPNWSSFPQSSLVDFSYLLDPPAGKHGFLVAHEDGFLIFSDGTRARFWGINIANRSLFQPKDTIDQVVDVIARAGFNLVRIHHIDEQGGIIDRNRADTRQLDEARLRVIDYWIARLKARGIYTYLDLLDYRTFKPGDGVENATALGRGAKPYAVFNRRLIELQKEYARQLLVEHVNAYTGLSYARDPAVAMLEIFDENGLFMKRNKWNTLAEPYQTEFKSLWNEWLRGQYGSTEELARTWTNATNECALMPLESLENSSVGLPVMELTPRKPAPYARGLRSPARKNDGSRFAYELQRRYFREMKTYLRDIGVRIPLTAVTCSNVMPDLKSVADELDFIGNNFYWDHPSWPKGKEWQPPSFFTNQNPLAQKGMTSFSPAVTISRIFRTPLVVREWNYCWPNRFRAAGMIEAAAYGCLHDLDAMILFTFGAQNATNPIDFFDVHRDPARWGLAGIAAKIFLRGDVTPSELLVNIAYSAEDAFSYYSYDSILYQLSFVCRTRNLFPGDVIPDATVVATSDARSLTIASGRSSTGRYAGRQQILRANDSAGDLYGHTHRLFPQSLEAYGFSGSTTTTMQTNAVVQTFLYDGTFMTERSVSQETRRSFPIERVVSLGMQPVGVTMDNTAAYGFYDPQRRNFCFSILPDPLALSLALDALGRLTGRKISRQMIATEEFVSDNGQIRRNQLAGCIFIDTPRFKAVAGNLARAREVRLGDVAIYPASEVGAIVISSLDDQPVERSQRLLLKSVSNARNTSQVDPYNKNLQRIVLEQSGRAPVMTYGTPSAAPTRIFLGGNRIVEVYQRNGIWECVIESGKVSFYSDTPNVVLKLPGMATDAKVVAFRYDTSQQDFMYDEGIIYPLNTPLVTIDPG